LIVGYAVEGLCDAPVAHRLIELVGRVPRKIHDSGGSSAIDVRLKRWGQSSNYFPMLVVRDWDVSDKCECIPELLSKVVPEGSPVSVAVRIPVRAMEAWLIADRDAAARYFGTSLPRDPDGLSNPKLALVHACRKSPAHIARKMVPSGSSGSRFGPQYVATVLRFATEHWDPERARKHSPSLDRTIVRLQQLVRDGIW
jgi:hypothetical protein